MPTQLGSQIDMSVMPGFEDLRPKAVTSLDTQTGEIVCLGTDGKFHRLQLYVTAQGAIGAQHVAPTPIDQHGPREPAQRRHAGVDQL